MVKDDGVQYLPPTRKGLKKKLFFLKNYFTYRYVKKAVLKAGISSLGQGSWLDLGCGPGNLDRQLENWYPNFNIIGVDASNVLLEYANSDSKRTKYLHGTAEVIPVSDGSVGVVSIMQVIEHIEQPDIVFKEIYRVLKDSGVLILTTPNMAGLGAKLLRSKWQGYSDQTHISLNTFEYWKLKVESSGFEIVSCGTTLFSGVPLIGVFPLSLIWRPLQVVFGYFPWRYGESINIIARKKNDS